jgi:NAD+ synthase (glutamine-hydrolysing)
MEMRITVAQLNPTVGDIDGNMDKMRTTVARAAEEGADLSVFPELFLSGYPPKDLLERAGFMRQVEDAVSNIITLSERYMDTAILFGAPVQGDGNTGLRTYNAALLVYRGEMIHMQYKSLLPTYDVFDETRYFDQAAEIKTVSFKGEKLGITICEDAWNDPELWPGNRMYDSDPVEQMAHHDASLFINISASPFSIGKEEIRFRLISGHAKRHGVPFLYVNQIGGNDELIFDGRSFFVDSRGRPVLLFPAFRENVATIETGDQGGGLEYAPQERIETVYNALVLGTRDYLEKCGFSKAVVGLSGGIDSSVTMCIAARALGRENVLGIAMPSPYSSKGSVEDSKTLAENLGVGFKIVTISDIYQSYLDTLTPHFEGREPDIAEENIQARIRGNILMSFSNKFGYLVLSTGNKSELAVGYCTLYGDMSGGLAIISDVPKTMVYEIAEYINRKKKIIPQSVIDKAPSAELRPDQKDQDTLPPYETLDAVLYALIEEGHSAEDIIDRGYDARTVRWITRTVQRNEYKRNQSAPGLKVTSKAFGVGRRFPIAARYSL